MFKQEVDDLALQVLYLQSLIGLRNFARIEARKGQEYNKSMWVRVYRDTVVRIKEVEYKIGKILPTGEFKRVAGKVKP